LPKGSTRHSCTCALDLVQRRRAELQAAQPDLISDERRIWALMALSARAEAGDRHAQATMREIEKLFGTAREHA
jgi:hypothetical protein